MQGAERNIEDRITELTADRAVVVVGALVEAQAEERVVSLVLGVPKGSKVDGIVRMVTELGVGAVHFANTERSVPRGAGSGRLPRLEKIAAEASRQSGRSIVPRLHPPAPLLEVLDRASAQSERWFLVPDAATALPRRSLAASVWVAVGPEGGFSPQEQQRAADRGWSVVRLGSPTLRVETAAPVAVALAFDRLVASV